LEPRSEFKAENVKDKGMRFIVSELGLNLSLNLNLNLILPLRLRLSRSYCYMMGIHALAP
jgi:hypothetical protein